MPLLLGAIADDATGATDLASMLVKRGMATVQTIGIPDETLDCGGADAVVVALKSRTAPVTTAVSESLAALDWLRRRGAEQIFFKYCSTFDSTPAGNIGPVADALMAALETDFAIVCPAFPTNARTLYQGHLFVGTELLSESSMKDHPLTPMTDANLVRVMERQSTHGVGLVPHAVVRGGAGAIEAAFERLRTGGTRYAVVDAIDDDDLIAIGHACATHRLVTGGSGVAIGLPDNHKSRARLGDVAAGFVPAAAGRAAVLSGSCSAATLGQLRAVRERWPYRQLDVKRLAQGEPLVAEILDWAQRQADAAPVVIAASAPPEAVRACQAEFGRDRIAALIEEAFAALARGLVERGVRRLVVAGGETSGAVVNGLGIEALQIGVEIAPGVPWTETIRAAEGVPRLALALKSGNFGGADFFTDAFARLIERP